MPTPTIPAGNKQMDALLYTGNGTFTTRTGLSLSTAPGLVWIKSRSAVANHVIEDSVSGTASLRYPDLTAIDGNTGGGWIQNLATTGFSTDVNGPINTSSATYVAWTWAGGGTAVANTSGTIASQVSANTTSGFSVVTYTGTGVAGTVGHGQTTTAPKFMLIKQRDVVVRSWAVYHGGLANPQSAFYLDSDAGAFVYTGFFNNIAPTNLNFSLGTDPTVNQSGSNYVAYCWAEVDGFSKFGTWAGNSSTNGPFVYLGFRPRFILFKRSSGDGNNWRITDTSRSTSNPNTTAFLYPDIDAVENSNANDSMDILSNGFKLRATAQASNETGSTYTYMAFAENPFKYANAR